MLLKTFIWHLSCFQWSSVTHYEGMDHEGHITWWKVMFLHPFPIDRDLIPISPQAKGLMMVFLQWMIDGHWAVVQHGIRPMVMCKDMENVLTRKTNLNWYHHLIGCDWRAQFGEWEEITEINTIILSVNYDQEDSWKDTWLDFFSRRPGAAIATNQFISKQERYSFDDWYGCWMGTSHAIGQHL